MQKLKRQDSASYRNLRRRLFAESLDLMLLDKLPTRFWIALTEFLPCGFFQFCDFPAWRQVAIEIKDRFDNGWLGEQNLFALQSLPYCFLASDSHRSNFKHLHHLIA